MPSPRRLTTVLASLLMLAVPAALAACGSSPADPPGAGPTTGGSTSTSTAGTATAISPATGTAGARTPGAATPGRTAAPPGGAGGSTVTLARSGGIAGVRESVSIKPDGSWTFYDKRGTKTETGRLTLEQHRKITRLATDPGLVAEIRAQSKPGVCNDGFQYSLQVGESQASFEDCGERRRPLTEQFLRTIMDATPM